jgi:hypothetical protein
MSEYREIQGAAIQSLSSSTGTQEGQIWYDNSAGAFKLQQFVTIGTFSTVASLSNTHVSSGAAGTSSSSALVFGTAAGGPPSLLSESFDGTSWTATNNMTQDGDYSNGFGTQTSAVAAGDGGPVGANSNTLWDGTCWTNSNPTSTYSYARAGLGTGTTLGALYGGTPTGGSNARVENWNGTSWTAGTAQGSGSSNQAAAGVVPNAALTFGGDSPVTAVTQLWNGSAWTTKNSMNTGRAAFGSGISTSALAAGGGPGTPAAVETWDGTCWSTNPASLNTARYAIPATMADATNLSTLVSGGGPGNTNVEEWTGPNQVLTKTLTLT